MHAEHDYGDSGDTYNPPAGVGEVHASLDAEAGQQHDLTGVHVTTHAACRFIERIDNSDLFPEARIRREFAEAVELADDRAHDPTRWHPGSGAVYVYDPSDMTVITVLPPSGEQPADHTDDKREVAA